MLVGAFMVWKRKRQTVDSSVSDKSLSSGGLVKSSGVAGSESPLGVLGHDMTAPTGAPKNVDTVKSDRTDRAPEFQMPVRASGAASSYVIPANYKISGDIFLARPVVIRGQFVAGVIEAPTVTVEPGGFLDDRAEVENLRVAGESQATVSASVGVEVSARGILGGAVTSPSLKVWPGANLKGAQVAIGARR